MRYANHPSALHERIWNAIAAPPCTRCMARADWHPTDCGKNGCHDLYAQEVAAVMEIVQEVLDEVKGDKLRKIAETSPSK